MPKLPVITYTVLAKKIKKAGYQIVRTNKHIVYCHIKRNITVPIPKNHRGDVPKGTLRTIINEMKITIEDFCNL